jgi:hypothetical protein
MRGAAGPQCVVEFGNNHFVIDGDQLYVHDGSTATRVGEDMFDVEFFKRAVNLRSATLCHDPENREIWIYFDTNYGRKSCIYSYATGTFGWGDGEAKGEPITYSSRGYLPQTGAQWGDMTQPWHELKEPENYYLWPEDEGNPLDQVPANQLRLSNLDIDVSNDPTANWKISIAKDKFLVAPPYKCSIAMDQSGWSCSEGDYVEFDWPCREEVSGGDPEKIEDYSGFRTIRTLRINGEEVDVDRISRADSWRPFRFIWKDSWGANPEIKMELDFVMATAVDGDPQALVVQGYYYKVATPNPEYEGKEFWRWSDQTTYTLKPKILALTSFGLHQKEAFFANNRECWVERKAIDLDDAGINGWVIKHLKQYHMQLAGEGKVGIRTGWAESALADPQWEKPTWLDENGDGSYQADMRTTGRYLSMRFEFKEMGQFRWANGYMDIEVSGRR